MRKVKEKDYQLGQLMELDISVDLVGHMMINPIENSYSLAIMSVHCASLGAVRHKNTYELQSEVFCRLSHKSR